MAIAKRLEFLTNNMFNIYINEKGQSIIELLIALSIFALIGAAMTTMVVGGFQALNQGGDQTEAEALAQEGIEAVKAIRERAWNENIYTQSDVATSSGEWYFLGEGTTETFGPYTRTITFEDVCRDSSNNITSCPGSYTDVDTKKINVSVSWTVRPGITNSVQKTAYISNWVSDDFIEDTLTEFTDINFVDSPVFSNTATSTDEGDLDGAIILAY